MKLSKAALFEAMEIIRDVKRNGFAIKKHHSIEFGNNQQYKATIYTLKKTINDLFVN